MTSGFSKLESKVIELNISDRLRIFHDFFRSGEEQYFNFNFDLASAMKKGTHFKDYISPDSFNFKSSYFEMGDKFGRVMFLKDFATYIKDTMISEITDLSRN